MVGRLFLAVPQGYLQFVIVVFPDHTHLLFFYHAFCKSVDSGQELWQRLMMCRIDKENADAIVVSKIVNGSLMSQRRNNIYLIVGLGH